MSHEIQSTTLYKKVGRRYTPVAQEWSGLILNRLPHGEAVLVVSCGEEMKVYVHNVEPDRAQWSAAAALAKEAMVEAMRRAAVGRPAGVTRKYTKRQLAIIERFREEMAAAGGLLPDCWNIASPEEIAQAGIDAVNRGRA